MFFTCFVVVVFTNMTRLLHIYWDTSSLNMHMPLLFSQYIIHSMNCKRCSDKGVGKSINPYIPQNKKEKRKEKKKRKERKKEKRNKIEQYRLKCLSALTWITNLFPPLLVVIMKVVDYKWQLKCRHKLQTWKLTFLSCLCFDTNISLFI